MQSIIASKHGTDIAKQAIDYAKTKVYKVNLPGKRFNTESGYSIFVFSAPSADGISFQISKLK